VVFTTFSSGFIEIIDLEKLRLFYYFVFRYGSGPKAIRLKIQGAH